MNDQPVPDRFSRREFIKTTAASSAILGFPAITRSKSPNGKLRLLYEGNPMSLIVEQAGGRSITGTQRILDIVPTAIHERTPVFCGCVRDVSDVEKRYAAMHATGGKGGGGEEPPKRPRV